MKIHFRSKLVQKSAITCLIVTFAIVGAKLFSSGERQFFWSKKRIEVTASELPGAIKSPSGNENSLQKPSTSRIDRTKQLRERKDELNAEVLKLDSMIEEEWGKITTAHPECKRLREIIAGYHSWNTDQRRISSKSFGVAQTWFQQSQNVVPMRQYYKVILTETYRDLAKDPEWATIINKSLERQLALSEAEKQSKDFTKIEQARSLEIDSFDPDQVSFERLPLDLLHMVKAGTIYTNPQSDLTALIPDGVKSWMSDTTVAAVASNSATVILDDLESDKLKSLKARRKTASYEAWNIHKQLQTDN